MNADICRAAADKHKVSCMCPLILLLITIFWADSPLYNSPGVSTFILAYSAGKVCPSVSDVLLQLMPSAPASFQH